MTTNKKVSSTALAKSKGITTKAMFELLTSAGYLESTDGKSTLTKEGEAVGGEVVNSKRFGEYVVWPEDINISEAPPAIAKQPLITATAIGKQFELSANKMNYILSELGWVNKSIKGWVVTDHGKKLGGIQSEDRKSGIPYVRWPEAIVKVKALQNSVGEVKGTDKAEEPVQTASNKEAVGFREKFPAKHRSADGHMVRSKAEMLVDNWLYMAEIVHAYERKLPIEEDVYCDFYIPTGKVYIEYWGYENEQKYLARKKKKISIYEKYGFNLIQLKDEDVQNLDDILPRLLLKYGIQAY
jgi:hypothetical protein